MSGTMQRGGPDPMRQLSILLALALPRPASACGPFLPEAMITAPPASNWVAPVADFGEEMKKLAPPLKYPTSLQQSIDIEVEELRITGPSEQTWRDWRRGRRPEEPTPPSGISRATLLYAEGGAMWRRGEIPGAIERWKQVLALPERERRDREVWASFMVARDNDRLEDYDRVLALVDGGAPDLLGLANESIGEKARVHFESQEWRPAVDLYLQQVGDGDWGAQNSLRMVVREALRVGAMDAWAEDPVLARVMTAWILANGGPYPDPGELERSRRWLDAVERSGAAPLVDADHLAWAHYQLGDVDAAQRWLDRSVETPLERWLRGRLLMRAGKLEEAEAVLVRAARTFPASERWDDGQVPERTWYDGMSPSEQAWGDVGMIRLARQDWKGAFGAFLGSGSDPDVAYVAERLLDLPTARALIAPLPRRPPPFGLIQRDEWSWRIPTDEGGDDRTLAALPSNLRYLLARREMRADRPVDLQDYPSPLRGAAAALVKARAKAASATRPQRRAAALWQEALLTRRQGLELMGTELDPDYAAMAGEFEVYPPTAQRFETDAGPLTATPAEAALWRASAPAPDKRFHYRYVAADLAKQAADLLPEDDPDVPILLCRATTWLLMRDPEAAWPYTKSHIHRLHRWPQEPCGDPSFFDQDLTWRYLGTLAGALLLAGLILRRAGPLADGL